MSFILGLDPGSQKTGYGILKIENHQVHYVESGVLRAKEKHFQERLWHLCQDLTELFAQFQPQYTVIEKIFLGENPHSAFVLGQLRGICLVEAQRVKSEIAEYSPREVKKGVTGYGHAGKAQVQQALFKHLRLKGQVLEDASDALGLAYFFWLRQSHILNRSVTL